MTALRLYAEVVARLWPLALVPPLAWVLAVTIDRWHR